MLPFFNTFTNYLRQTMDIYYLFFQTFIRYYTLVRKYNFYKIKKGLFWEPENP